MEAPLRDVSNAGTRLPPRKVRAPQPGSQRRKAGRADGGVSRGSTRTSRGEGARGKPPTVAPVLSASTTQRGASTTGGTRTVGGSTGLGSPRVQWSAAVRSLQNQPHVVDRASDLEREVAKLRFSLALAETENTALQDAASKVCGV